MENDEPMVSVGPGSSSEQRGIEGEDRSSSRPALSPHFLSRLAHDIRSPLGLLSGALEEIRADLGAQLDEGHTRMLSLAERGLARLDRMARMLSTVAQIEGNTLSLSRESYDLSRLVREVVESVEREDPRRGLELDLELPQDTKLEIDPERVREALWELVAQARRQAKTRVRIAIAPHGEMIELAIEDDGRGFDAAEKRHAFDRLHEPPDKRGSGFALSVSRDLIRAHGGDITITDARLPASRPGNVGCCFAVTFPR